MTGINEWEQRTELQTGKENIEKLHRANVMVVGLGGVGAYAAEMLCRAGVGNITLVDGDTVHPSNLNRQLLALQSTLGSNKATLMAERLKDINPQVNLEVIGEYIRDDKMVDLLDKKYDFVVDAIDTLSPKVYLIYHSINKGFPVVSSMGAGGKYDPAKVEITDISESHTCKFARILRKRLHKLGITEGFKVVFSSEVVDDDCIELVEGEKNKRSIVGTISYMPAVFGCCCASAVIRDLIGK
jgi:tRNA A37 threonylcarbamoyladenosine dehydratase